MSIEQPEKSTPPATTVTSTGDQQEPTRLGGDPPISVDRSLLRLGAAFGALGVVLQIITDRLHPHRVDPNDSAAVFREYATSDIWTAVHIGQFAWNLVHRSGFDRPQSIPCPPVRLLGRARDGRHRDSGVGSRLYSRCRWLWMVSR